MLTSMMTSVTLILRGVGGSQSPKGGFGDVGDVETVTAGACCCAL